MNKTKRIIVIALTLVFIINLIGCTKNNKCKDPYETHPLIASLTYETDSKYHWHHCVVCGKTFDKEKHEFSEWTIVEEATIEKKGLKVRYCQKCLHEEKKEYEFDELNVTKNISNDKNTNERINNLIVPDGTVSIEKSAFHSCADLASIIIPNSVTSIGDYAFYNCSNLTSIIIPDSVTSIGQGAFYFCKKLTNITIPDSVKSIETNLFCNCSNLNYISIGNGVTYIGNYAFYYCCNLTSITIPDSVTSIGDYAFQRCSNLTSIIMPNSVTSIGKDAFYGCSSLETITFNGTKSQYNSLKVKLYSDCKIFCTDGVIENQK